MFTTLQITTFAVFLFFIFTVFSDHLRLFDEFRSEVERKNRAEFELRWCGQILANRLNLEQAREWALKLFPSKIERIHDNTYAALSLQTIPTDFKVQLLDEKCFHPDFPELQAQVYLQRNPSIPHNWPNYHFLLTGVK